ncbi:MAG: 3-phosphoshikimate 1-carboxyvinyltransferase [Phycisphaerae bacterium]
MDSAIHAIEVQAAEHPFVKTVVVPGSKSITNRAMPLAAMAAGGVTTLRGALFADDTWHMIGALQQLGLDIVEDAAAKRIRVEAIGRHGVASTQPLYCGNSGTTIRFLTALCAAVGGRHILDGNARMRQRPMAELAAALAQLGCPLRWGEDEGFPPVIVEGEGLAGGECSFLDVKSSQFISAVLMAAPLAQRPVSVRLNGPVTSEPYVNMTLRMMRQFGADFSASAVPGGRCITVQPRRYVGGLSYQIEPDASNASYFLAAAALVPGSRVRIEGLGSESLQGDVAFADVLRHMGATVVMEPTAIEVGGTGFLRGVSLDMNAIPDMVQTLAVLAVFAQGPTTVSNVGNLRLKETDRLAALQTELTKLGAKVSTTSDSIHIVPPGKPTPAVIATYDDHRMAMAFAVAGLRIKGIHIENPQCTSKTYPDFFKDFAQLTQ